MQIVTQTEYQDIYRVASGVLLVINKFKYVQIPENRPLYSRYAVNFEDKRRVLRKYNANTEDSLKVFIQDYTDAFGNKIKKGQVIMHERPVQAIKSGYTYQIKTTGDQFSGSKTEILIQLQEIMNTIKGEEEL